MVVGCMFLTNACDEAAKRDTLMDQPDAANTSNTTEHTAVDSMTPSTSDTSQSQSQSHNATTDAGLVFDAGQPAPSSALDASSADAATQPGEDSSGFRLPPENGGLDYQLGGGYELPQGVTIVSRDRTDTPASGAYNICYINGFQVQPGEEEDWDADLLLRDEEGGVVIDEDWDEALLDVSSADKRERIAAVIAEWINQCASDGFDAIEIDNLDTYTRSDGRILEDDAVDFIARLSAIAHAAGLAIAQKNAVELVPRRDEMNTDFVVSEECNAWEECDGYIEAYGAAVLMIEYDATDFARGCELYGDEFSVVFRDRNLTTPSSETYVFDGC